MESVVLSVTAGHSAADCVRLSLQATCKTLYVHFADVTASEPDANLLTDIAQVFDAVAVEKPCQNVVPLLRMAGWTQEQLNKLKAKVTDPSLQVERSYHSDSSSSSNLKEEASRVEVIPRYMSLRCHKVAVGGTFDRLHAGHRSLLAATALVATDYVFVGITGDQLLVNKKHKELLESYEVRKDAVVAYLKSVRPTLNVAAGPLLDPKARTMAATDSTMDALVVSQETLDGGHAINADRESQGLNSLTLVVVNLVGLGSKALGGQKLSSTALREKEAQKAEEAQHQASS